MLSSVVLFGLLSAVTWGAADFSGGFSANKYSEFTVVVVSQIIGGLFLIPTALLFREQWPAWSDLFLAMFGGIFGAIGLLALYRALADGPMGLVAPLAAMVSAILPLIFGLFIDGLPPLIKGIGILVALPAVWLISGGGSPGKINVPLKLLLLPVIAGAGFSIFFVTLDRMPPGSVFWPLFGARIASVTLFGAIGLYRGVLERPKLEDIPVIGLAGIFDTLGNAFFTLSAQSGRLDIAAVLSSLYPVSTMVLARYILQERSTWLQLLGAAIALVAIVLIAL
ncbi:MAG: DMT family transporter [Chloroflexota bacterium]